MTRSILTVPFAFFINVSSLILSWLLILPLPTHCTKVKDTVLYYSVTYMLLIWRKLNDLFSYKNMVNSNSQYLAVQHVLYIYRDGTMALAKMSGHVLANLTTWLFSCQDASNWSCRRYYSCMFTCRSTSPWQTERVNGELHLCQNSGRCPQ